MTLETREDLETLKKITFWNSVQAKDISQEMENVLTRLIKSSYESLATKKSKIDVIKNHLKELSTALVSNDCNGCPNWANMDRQARLHEFIKNEHCQISIDRREARKNKFNLRKKVCQSFSEVVADKNAMQII